MTREDAIFVLECVKAHGLADDAKRVAIEALKSEPIVRCGECKWWQEDGVCRLLSNNYYPVVNMDDDDYCSRGVRKDEVAK